MNNVALRISQNLKLTRTNTNKLTTISHRVQHNLNWVADAGMYTHKYEQITTIGHRV
jgi:hypothetical protein